MSSQGSEDQIRIMNSLNETFSVEAGIVEADSEATPDPLNITQEAGAHGDVPNELGEAQDDESNDLEAGGDNVENGGAADDDEDDDGIFITPKTRDPRPPVLIDPLSSQSSTNNDGNEPIAAANEEQVEIGGGDFHISSTQRGKPKVFYNGHG